MNHAKGSIPALLEAAELLLADVQNQREAIDRRERDLREQIAGYRSRLGTNSNGTTPLNLRRFSSTPVEVEPTDDDEDGGDTESYGAITESAIRLLHLAGRRMNASDLASALETNQVPIRAKSYLTASRTVLRRLHKMRKVRKVATGFYRLEKRVVYSLGAPPRYPGPQMKGGDGPGAYSGY